MTPKQAEALEYIRIFIENNGYSPSYDELRDGLEYKSKSRIHGLIHSLVAHGKITVVSGKNRSIEVVKQ